MDFCVEFIQDLKEAAALNEGPLKHKFYHPILVTAMAFEQLSHNAGFGPYSTIGALEKAEQQHISCCIINAIKEFLPNFSSVLSAWNPKVTLENLQPYPHESENI